MIKFLPENMQTRACEPVVASAMETIDWCEKAQEADCNLVTAVETWDLQGIQEAISDMVLSQNEMKSEIKEALESMEQKISWLWASSTSEENTLEKQLVEKREQQKKELQSQIEALQAEMENL